MKKPRIRYQLKLKNGKNIQRSKEELILAEINAGFTKNIGNKLKYDRCIISLKASIKPQNFGKIENNYKYDEVIFEKFSKSNGGIKTKMQILSTAVDQLYNNYIINNEIPTSEQFKIDLLIRLGIKTKVVEEMKEIEEVKTMYLYLNEKITKFEELKGSGRKKEINENSIKIYRTLLTYLTQYEHVSSTELHFQKFDEKTYWDFWEVLDDILKGNIKIPNTLLKRKRQIKPNGFLKSSIRKYQKALIKILKLASEDDYKIELNLENTDLILKDTPASKNLYIDKSNLIKINNYVPITNEMQLAKDYVILAAMTGMRYESMEIAHLEEIQKDKDFMYIHSKQNKTGTDCYIPLMSPVLGILNRYNNKFPKFPKNQIINKQIKELFKLVGIDSTVERTLTTYRSGTIKDKITVADLITTHDFRKSFITNLILEKVNENIIMNITHPDRERANAMIIIYDKSTLLDKAKQFYNEINLINKVSQNELYKF